MSFMYKVAKILAPIPLKLGGIRIIGKENIPDDAALLVICNHISYGDPLAVGYALPREMTFIAKEDFSKNFFTRTLFSSLGAVFLKKDESDLTTMRIVLSELKKGNVVALFPEGRRNIDQQMSEFKDGASFIAHRAQVRVLPMAVINTGDYWRFWKRNIIVVIGEPIDTPTGKMDKKIMSEQTKLYKQKVEELFDKGLNILKSENRPMRKVKNKKI